MRLLKFSIIISVFFGFSQIALSQQEFSIKDKVFEDGVDAVTFLDFFTNKKDGELSFAVTPGEDGAVPARDISFAYFAYGVTHRWLGKAEYQGYVFESDSINPLVFKVVRDKGYTYLRGVGIIKKPDGTIIKLPLKK